MMDIFIPFSSTLSQPHDAINSIIRENYDEDRNISKLVKKQQHNSYASKRTQVLGKDIIGLWL